MYGWRSQNQVSLEQSLTLRPSLHPAHSFIYFFNRQCCFHASCVSAAVLGPRGGSSVGASTWRGWQGGRTGQDLPRLGGTAASVPAYLPLLPLRTAPQGQSWPKDGNLKHVVGLEHARITTTPVGGRHLAHMFWMDE